MSNPHALRLIPALLLLLAGCASGPPRQPVSVADRNLLMAEEMRAAGYTDAFRAVQSMRPHWLRIRGPTSFSQPEVVIKVYLDGSLMGGPEQLQRITISSISSIRFLDANEATQRWGFDHVNGAILVSTRGDGSTRGTR
jgi:hypothetical protein